MSENEEKEECFSLFLRIPKNIMRDFNSEIVRKYGRTYENIPKAVEEAIVCWVEVERGKRK